MARDKICTPFLALASPEDKFTVSTIEDMQSRKYLKIGDIVELNGYYTAGDGAHHKRKIESADDGSGVQLANGLWANIVHNGEVNVSWFGVNENTENVQAKLEDICNNLDVKCVNIDTEINIYTTDPIVIRRGDITVDGKNKKISINSEGANYSDPRGQCVLLEIQNTIEPKIIENVCLKNLLIDGTKQEYKGGSSLQTKKNTSANPIARGICCIELFRVKNCVITNNNLIDVYGDGIKAHDCSNVIVEKNNLRDVGGGNIFNSGVTGWDNFGDGIIFYKSYNVKMINNTVVNTRRYLEDVTVDGNSSLGTLCGRSGLEFEYTLDRDGHKPIDGYLFKIREGFALTYEGNYINGYTKGIHNEDSLKYICKNNTILNCPVGIMHSSFFDEFNLGTVISENFLSNDNGEKTAQSGYNSLSASIVLSNYFNYADSGKLGSKGLFIRNNIFKGESRGVYIATSPYAFIENNVFNCNSHAIACYAGVKNFTIANNLFFNCGHVNLLKAEEVVFVGNTCTKRTDATRSEGTYTNNARSSLLLENSKRSLIKNNKFDNFYVELNNSNTDAVIDENVFVCKSFVQSNETHPYIKCWRVRDLKIRGNFFGQENTYKYFVEVGDSLVGETLIQNNKIEVETQSTIMNFGASVEDLSVEGNKVNSETLTTLIRPTWQTSYTSIKNNTTAQESYIIDHTNVGNSWNAYKKYTKIENNTGKIRINFKLNNYTIEKYYNKGEKWELYESYNSVIGRVCVKSGYHKSDGTGEASFEDLVSTNLIATLDTPYYAYKMQQEGVYEDFVAYMDSKLEYDKEQRYLEEQRQLAFESREDQEQTYEEWLAEQPMFIPMENEPQPSEKLLKFKEKYLG